MNKAVSIESVNRVDHVESGLPRWLIEAAFVAWLLQAVINYGPIMDWITDSGNQWVDAIISAFGSIVVYLGLLSGMKSLYRPFTVLWWIIIALNIAGFITNMIPSIMFTVGLPVAVALMLVYLPLGCALAISYRGRLRQVGIWMALYILISEIIPVLAFLLLESMPEFANLLMEIPTIAVIVIYGWVLRRVLV